MKNNTPSKEIFIILIIIVIAALGLFFYLQGTPVDSGSSLETAMSPESLDAQEAANRVLQLLNEIRALRIDDSIFKSAVFQSLVDYTVAIPEQPVGRVNPFASVPSQSH
jgi:hypothetical protein